MQKQYLVTDIKIATHFLKRGKIFKTQSFTVKAELRGDLRKFIKNKIEYLTPRTKGPFPSLSSDGWQGPKETPLQTSILVIPSFEGTYSTVTLNLCQLKNGTSESHSKYFQRTLEAYHLIPTLANVCTDGAAN